MMKTLPSSNRQIVIKTLRENAERITVEYDYWRKTAEILQLEIVDKDNTIARLRAEIENLKGRLNHE